MDNKIKLSILGISFSQVQAGAYALIFAEENGIRRLPVVIGTPEAQSIAIIMENLTPPRPLSHDLVSNIFTSLDIILKEVFIYKFEDGAFFAELLLEQEGKELRIDSRTSDAVAIALRTKSPIYTTEEIMKNMAIVFDEKEILDTDFKKGETTEEPEEKKDNIFKISIDTLKERLDEAVAEENYELATKIRDEIERRSKAEGN